MKQKFIIITLLVLLGTSCTEDIFVSNQSGKGDVQVTANWTKSRVSFDEIDNITYANWSQSDRINLYTSSQGSWEYHANIEGDASSATFVPSGDGLKNVDGEKVYACYHTPFTDISTEIVDGVVALPNTSFIHGTHYVPLPFAYAISKIENSKVNFHFEHVFSYLKLTLELDEEYLASVGDKTLSRLLVKSSSDSLGIVSGKFNFADKKVIINEASDIIEMIAVSALDVAYIPILPQEANVEMSIYGLHDTETNCDTLFSIKKQTPTTGFLVGNVYRLGIRGNIVPKLDTIYSKDLTSTSLSVTSSVIDAGTSPISEVGFCYSTDNQEPNKETDTFIDLTDQKDNESFSTIIDGLDAGNTYYIRAYAVSADGIGYSDVISYIPIMNPGIYSMEDWNEFCTAKNGGSSDLSKWKDSNGVINLYTDLDFQNVGISTCFLSRIEADEILDGNGHVLSGIVTSYQLDFDVSLIYINAGTIKNLHLSEGQIMGGLMSGQVAAFCIENSGLITDCSNKLNVYSSTWNAAGFCVNNTGSIVNCVNWGDIIVSDYAYAYAVGIAHGGVVSNCQNYGNVSGVQSSGIGGQSVSNCINYGTIGETYENEEYYISFNGVATDAAGITITGSANDCTNEGKVISSNRAGGIVAFLDNEDIINNCINKGDISSEGFCGGIIGVILKTSVFYVAGNVNTNGGTVNGILGDETNAIGGDERNGIPSIDDLPTGKWYYD